MLEKGRRRGTITDFVTTILSAHINKTSRPVFLETFQRDCRVKWCCVWGQRERERESIEIVRYLMRTRSESTSYVKLSSDKTTGVPQPSFSCLSRVRYSVFVFSRKTKKNTRVVRFIKRKQSWMSRVLLFFFDRPTFFRHTVT